MGADPIGPSDRFRNLIEGFLRLCESRRLAPCFLGVNGHNLDLYRAQGLRVLKIGEECILDLPSFDAAHLKRKLRRAERHCLNLGITCTVYAGAEVPEGIYHQALAVSGEWLRTRGGFERGFSMTLGRFPRPEDRDARVVAAMQGSRVMGFLTFMPVSQVDGWSLDMMRRTDDSPNGLTEFMVIQSARMLQAEGSAFMSLNFAAFQTPKGLWPNRWCLPGCAISALNTYRGHSS